MLKKPCLHSQLLKIHFVYYPQICAFFSEVVSYLESPQINCCVHFISHMSTCDMYLNNVATAWKEGRNQEPWKQPHYYIFFSTLFIFVTIWTVSCSSKVKVIFHIHDGCYYILYIIVFKFWLGSQGVKIVVFILFTSILVHMFAY
jgi:hypothetical protein